MRALTLAFAAFSCVFGHALNVNRLNGSAGVVYVDFNIPGPVLPLELARSYNSITTAIEQKAWVGAFGWGWTSPFETTLTVTPDRNVLLRDGSNGNTVLFRPETEDPKLMTQFIDEVKKAYFERKKNRKIPADELAKQALPERMVSQLKHDPDFRSEMASKYGITAEVPAGQVLVSSEFGYQTIYQKNNQWVRTRDAMTQVFDKEGRLVKQMDKGGFYLNYTYAPNQKFQLELISDSTKAMSLRFKWRNDRVIEVTDNKGTKATYAYDPSGNLTQATDSNRQTYKYSYEHKKFPHLLTKIEYVTESKTGTPVYRTIRYDDNALVVYHREKDGAETNYTYGKIARDPENNFWTKAIRTAGSTKEETYDEFLIKARPDGTKYLYKQDNKINGVLTSTLFTPCCGKPLEITRNGQTTSYKYYANGQLKERVGPNEDIKIEYEPRWKKVTRVVQNGVVSTFSYDPKGNLTSANNPQNKVSLKYDKLGRILEMADSSGKAITFQYGEMGKPTLISEAGVGAIKIAYDTQGRIKTADRVADKKSKSPKEDAKEVVKRVMHEFQTFLDIIRPAGIAMNMG